MSAPGENKARDYSRYDQMSTAELEQLLRLDFHVSKDGGSDLDAISYISALLAERKGPSDWGTAWAQFQAKYRPYADGRSLYDFEEAPPEPAPLSPLASKPRSARRVRRLAVLAAVLAALLLGGMAAQAAGVDVFRVIAQWTDETFHFIPTTPEGASSSDVYDADMEQLRSSPQTAGMEDWFPAWYLDGFLPGTLNAYDLNLFYSATVDFLGPDRSYSVTVHQFTRPTDNTGTFEKDDTPVETYDHRGQTFYILSNIDTLTATTYNGEFMVTISGMLTRDEIKAVIDSIPNP